MGALSPRWVVVDELVRELGSLRAAAEHVEAQAPAGHDVAGELRTSLARATDTIHLVIGGDLGMVEQAWRTIAAAQEVGARARTAVAESRAATRQSEEMRASVRDEVQRVQRVRAELRAMREATRRLFDQALPKKS